MSRFSVLSDDYDNKPLRPLSVTKPPSVRSRKAQRGQICLVEESIFTPLSAALNEASGPLVPQKGLSLTVDNNNSIVPVSHGILRPCIVMDAPSGGSARLRSSQRRTGQTKDHYICLMATFAASEGQYDSLEGELLQRLVVPMEPNEQLPPNSTMYPLQTDPAWHHPQQWVITYVIRTRQPLTPYTTRYGKEVQLTSAEYARLAAHCCDQKDAWKNDTATDEGLRQEMYDQLVNWKPELFSDKRSSYTCRSKASFSSLNSQTSWRAPRSRRGSNATLQTIVESITSSYPEFKARDFPPLPSRVRVV
ncbi:hypothetical protein EDD85DRAFT_1021113 [Armillaria nabsnona]|nr:hypothetical protein EDD85DRAFT_1021113 [Armillaria nabsnona]